VETGQRFSLIFSLTNIYEIYIVDVPKIAVNLGSPYLQVLF